MKKISLISGLIFIICLSLQINAQNRIGITGGLNLAKFKLDINLEDSIFENKDVSNRSLFGFGIVADFRLKDNLYLRIEPKYLKKGGNKQEEMPSPGFKVAYTYFELPVYFKYEFGNGGFKPYLITGPTIGFLSSTDVELSMAGVTFTGDMKDVTKSTDFGFGFGCGITYKLGNFDVFIQGCYTLGLKNISKAGSFDIVSGVITESVTVEEDDSFKNRGIQIMAGLTIPFGKK